MVYFVGAGTGAADLITVRGKRLIEQADVIIYAGSLVNPELLAYAKKACEIHNSAHLTLEEVIQIIERAEAHGKMTVRLHTGDPSVYGAVREQMDKLERRGISYESCPGVSACFGAAASLNLEYTLPGISQSLIITRMEGRTKVPEKERIECLAAHRASMAVYLSAGMLEELGRKLIAGGYDKTTPAALVYKATWEEEEAYVCTVETLAAVAKEHGIAKTALVLVGDAIAHQNYQKSRLYAPDFATAFRKAKEPQTVSDAAVPGKTEKLDIPSAKISLCVISFTRAGMLLSTRIKETLIGRLAVELYTKCKAGIVDAGRASIQAYAGEPPVRTENTDAVRRVAGPVGEWAGQRMREKSAILFIGACGIAVRAVAPFLTDKLQDAPVLVMDEKGNYVVPILSGHVGGANALAKMIARKIGAQPVITTATDLNDVFAVDVFAMENGFAIENKDGIAKISAKILAGETVTASIETGHCIALLERSGICAVPYPPAGPVDLVITSEKIAFDASLVLRPKEYILGLGCKKGKEAGKIEQFIAEKAEDNGILISQIFAVASISQKRDEEGILAWCLKEKIPFLTYSAEELQEMEGDFTASAFVKEQVGVDNVCERAALKACGAGGELIVHKCAENGMTLAVAKRQW